MKIKRVLVWFSCGIASTVCAMKAIEKYGNGVEILYCDTLATEHPDNIRFMADVSKWLGKQITILRSKEYKDIWDVFESRKWLRSGEGAPCTQELKKRVRWDYEGPGDLQLFGYTGDEKKRWLRFKEQNPEVKTEWILKGVSKQKCLEIVRKAGIELPTMYKMGYPNNNCTGCVKAESVPYWQHIRRDFPAHFAKMAVLERRLGFSINRKGSGKNRTPLFLDELPDGIRPMRAKLDIECGVVCGNQKSGGI